ncbi:MAG: PA2779 family protein [Terriglobia bacterium]
MLTLKRQSAFVGTAGMLFTLFVVHSTLGAQNHVVSSAEIQSAAVAATSTRQHNVQTVTEFLSSPKARQALQSAHVNPTQVKTAVSNLSDEEVAQLASRVDKAQADFAAGNMSDRDLILIILAVLVLILIIVAVR